jgi:glycosyltransferase involved in cell wall biosynthesis
LAGPRILAIMPAYNENESIGSTIDELKSVRPDVDILVVDDGSLDNTADIARQHGCAVASLPMNLGLGGAVQTGLRYAAQHGYDVAFQYDADGQHRADQIQHITEPILNGEADMVLGSRFLEGKKYKVSAVRGLAMWLLRSLSSAIIHQRITDNTSGFRAYSSDAVRFMITNCSFDYPEIEAIIRLTRDGFRYREAPVIMRERVAGTSMFTPARATYFVLRSLMSILMSALDVKPKSSQVPSNKGGELV